MSWGFDNWNFTLLLDFYVTLCSSYKFTKIINFFNAIWLHSRNFNHFKFVEILADFKKVRGGKSPEKIDKFKVKIRANGHLGKVSNRNCKSF